MSAFSSVNVKNTIKSTDSGSWKGLWGRRRTYWL